MSDARLRTLLEKYGEDEVVSLLTNSPWTLLREKNFGRKSFADAAIWAWRSGRITTEALVHHTVGLRQHLRARLSESEFAAVERTKQAA